MSNKKPPARHPIQPLELDDRDVLRFKRNAIVDYCVKQVGLNNLAALFRVGEREYAEDWDQLAQLIGYSHSGAPSYLSDVSWKMAQAMYEEGLTEAQAQIQSLTELLDDANAKIQQAADVLGG